MPSAPWYTQYEPLSRQLNSLKTAFEDRCTALQISPNTALSEIWMDVIARAVHESNWQEGIQLERGRTRELAIHVFDDLEGVAGPHLDFSAILAKHKQQVLKMKHQGAQLEEIAAYNLSASYLAIIWIGMELARRHTTALAYALRLFREVYDKKEERAFSG